MADLKYGTPEFYKEQFLDFVVDADYSRPEYGNALVQGFLMAIQEMRQYHLYQVSEYDRIEQRVRQASTL
jgi:hypothetical protein